MSGGGRPAFLVVLALASCPDGLSAFTLVCLPPEACPSGATCPCPDGGELDGGGGTSSGTGGSSGRTASSGSSSAGSSSGVAASSSGSSGGHGASSSSSGSSGGASSSGGLGSSSGGGSCGNGGCGPPDAGDPCAVGPLVPPVSILASSYLILGLAVQGGALYFTTFDGNMELYKYELAGGKAAVLLGSIIMNNGVSYAGNNVRLDATHAYWVTDDADTDTGAADEILLDGGDQQALATGQAGGPVALAVDATNLYWADYGTTDGGSVWKVPLAGGPAVELASAMYPSYLAVDANNVYWSTLSAGVQEVAIDGGAVTTLVGIDYGSAGIAVDSNNVYFGFDESIEAMSLATGSISVLANNQTYPQGMILDGTTLYWTTTGTNETDGGTVMKLPLGCLEPIELAAVQDYPSPAIVDATNVYWVAGLYPTYQVMSVPK